MSFVPDASGGYLLATNRDERLDRGEALPPAVRELGGRPVCAPTDSEAGGTWVVADAAGHALCLLNGDRRAPGVRFEPDAPSRGLLVLELAARLGTADEKDLVGRLLLERERRGKLEENPFQLLHVSPATRDPHDAAGAPGLSFFEWDGLRLQREDLHGVQVFTSSSTDADEVRRRRREAFEQWWAERGGGSPDRAPFDWRALAGWHAAHAPGDAAGDVFSVCKHGATSRSVSTTVVEVRGDGRVAMHYRAGQPCEGAPFRSVDVDEGSLSEV